MEACQSFYTTPSVCWQGQDNLMLSILNLSTGASGALLALVCWKPSTTLYWETILS